MEAIGLLVLILIVLAIGFLASLIVIPLAKKLEPMSPHLWPDETLWHGEEIVYSSFACLEVEGRWAAGFLYLTEFRLVWVAGQFWFYRAPGVPSLSLRLPQIERVELRSGPLRQPKLHVTTGGEDYAFFFALYLIPLVTTGDSGGHKKWDRVLRERLPTA